MIRRASIGQGIETYTLTNAHGAGVVLANLGASILSINLPDRSGAFKDVVIGYDQADALKSRGGYMGAVVGRYANRIGNGRFELNGRIIQLAKNDGGRHHLHGGNAGFDKKIWDAQIDGERVVFTCLSADGEENFPGNMKVKVTYGFDDGQALILHYEAVSDKDTIINLTNQVYFNLGGYDAADISDMVISIDADRFTVIDGECIPTGELRDVTGTEFDLRAGKCIGDGLAAQAGDEQLTCGNGYDHNFVLNGSGLRKGGDLYDPASGRKMEFYTDKPGVQFYSGNFLNGKDPYPGKDGKPIALRKGLCLETQHFPDSINHKNFPQPIYRAGEKYDFTTIYKFSVK